MKAYIFKRLLHLFPVLFGVSLLTFSLLYLTPGDAAQKKLTAQGIAVTQELIEQERETMGLNKPFWSQYGSWISNVLRGDLGLSYKDGQPVHRKIGKSLGNTLLLAFCSLGAALLAAVPLGIYAAVRSNRMADHVIRFISFLGNSVPGFLLAVLLMYVFCIRLGWFPVMAKNNIQGIVLPALSLALPLAGRFTRQIRAEILEQLDKGYINGARARGVREWRVLLFNALRSCVAAIITSAALAAGILLGGSVVAEVIFSWPGIGKVVMDAISDRDYPVIQGYVLLMAVIYSGLNLASDISYRLLDPRVER